MIQHTFECAVGNITSGMYRCSPAGGGLVEHGSSDVWAVDRRLSFHCRWQWELSFWNCRVRPAHMYTNTWCDEKFKEFKVIVHPKMKILSSFNISHPQVVPNLYEFLSSTEHRGRHFEECQ